MLQTHSGRSESEDRFRLLFDLIEAYYQTYPTGGSLHIVFEYHNMSRGDIKYCEKYAREHNDSAGEGIARLMLELSDADIARWQETFILGIDFPDATSFASYLTHITDRLGKVSR